MYLRNLKEDKNYLPYIFGGFILSNVIFEFYYRNKWLAIFIASCFFIFVYFYKKIIFLVVAILFFCIGIFNNMMYYSYIPHAISEARLLKTNYYGGIGEVNGRKIYLEGNLEKAKIGDRLVVNGKFYNGANKKLGIVGSFKIDNIKILENDLRSKLYRLREKIFYKIKDKLGSRRAALITSISFGYTEFLDEEDKSNMKSLGLMHAVAVSGLHMALVYGLINKLFSDKIAPLIAFLYLVFTGASVSTIRAYIMILCMNLSVPLKRNYNPIAGISLAGIIILIIKPYGIFEVGFQLSFLATLGIILFNKSLNRNLYKLHKYLRETISICIAAQVFVFPALIIYFGEFSISFIIGNLILSPLISLLVICGNILAITMKVPLIFDYLCFIVYYVTRVMDLLLGLLEGITPQLMYLNESVVTIYLSILISIYFYKKGFKNIIYMPYILMIYVLLLIYSPFPEIHYYKEGALALSYKGDRIIIQLKSDLDTDKLSKIAIANKIYKDTTKIIIGKQVKLIKKGNNFILKNRNREYLLVISKDKIPSGYDIINFRENNFSKIRLLSDNVIILD